MSIFDFIFGSTSRRKVSFSDREKLNRQDIIDLVWNIESLDNKQKGIVKTELLKQLDDGGVSKWEYEEIIRQLSLRRVELGLSEIDIKNLRKIL
ncbi:hypothetical protein COU49_01635 [Candidatus Nomurabacteria bacterium CG10_big_fil_rev_8_21_14_0_10_35_16]|uniref:Uncharacterized protein n=1 Tax=Candidatus Nomurabacteria bacterium CG10_big_fil_rev_8_21_14_0_10_35_16 TaxID=1974731 RepID=A0A2H0TBF6_9BACT|nr:MAG: hypothetical protein COU49_01635 [Candidatus Nomurabacteria bacterium CG10_big_fil_rev_8_21_14_0_10_35_16]